MLEKKIKEKRKKEREKKRTKKIKHDRRVKNCEVKRFVNSVELIKMSEEYKQY